MSNKYTLNKKTIDRWVKFIQKNFNDIMTQEAAIIGKDPTKKELDAAASSVESRLYEELNVMFEDYNFGRFDNDEKETEEDLIDEPDVNELPSDEEFGGSGRFDMGFEQPSYEDEEEEDDFEVDSTRPRAFTSLPKSRFSRR